MISKKGPSPKNPEPLNVLNETRIALVMYGGVSLAIYIFGVARELFNLVRSTAVGSGENADAQPKHSGASGNRESSEPVYREIGRRLNTRFVIDILSGSSAGGLNSIFLSKALVSGSGLDPFDELRNIWENIADINILLNDQKSYNDWNSVDEFVLEEKVDGLKTPFTIPKISNYQDPEALFLSHRLYYRLLKLLKSMNPEKSKTAGSPYVDELDLFVTATDLYGREIKLPVNKALFEKSGRIYRSQEKKHRKVFQFKYAKEDVAGVEINQLTPDYDEFLAFAGRSTSSIPPAFEPVRLTDIQPYVPETKRPEKEKIWESFFEDRNSFLTRSFADGGYLDNKPFSYATRSLLNRRANLPVDRKLFYIEPSPERRKQEDEDIRPDVFQNISKALLTLPRYETISQDIQFIEERNVLIERFNESAGHIDDVLRRTGWISTTEKGVWSEKDLIDSIREMGGHYGLYISLRVSKSRDLLRDIIADLLSITGDDPRMLLGDYVESWFEGTYLPNRNRIDLEKIRGDILGMLARWDEQPYIYAWEVHSLNPSTRREIEEEYKQSQSYKDKAPSPEKLRLRLRAGRLEEEFRIVERLEQVGMDRSSEENPLERSKAVKEKLTKIQQLIDSSPFSVWNTFLYKADFSWRERRIAYLHKRINQLLALEYSTGLSKSELNSRIRDELYLEIQKNNSAASGEKLQNALWLENKLEASILSDQKKDFDQTFFGELRAQKEEINALRARYLRKPIASLKLEIEEVLSRNNRPFEDKTMDLHQIIGPGFRSTLQNQIEQQQYQKPALEKVGSEVRSEIIRGASAVHDQIDSAAMYTLVPYISELLIDYVHINLRLLSLEFKDRFAYSDEVAYSDRPGEVLARGLLNLIYSNYEYYDQLLFPIQDANELGEVDTVDVWRVSPNDVDQAIVPGPFKAQREGAPSKLGGDQLSRFGGFFNRRWRLNDILWGRLDGAEMIINSLMRPGIDEKLQAEWLRRVRIAIINDELKSLALSDGKALLGEAALNPIDENADTAEIESKMRVLMSGFEIGRLNLRDYKSPGGRALNVFSRISRSLANRKALADSSTRIEESAVQKEMLYSGKPDKQPEKPRSKNRWLRPIIPLPVRLAEAFSFFVGSVVYTDRKTFLLNGVLWIGYLASLAMVIFSKGLRVGGAILFVAVSAFHFALNQRYRIAVAKSEGLEDTASILNKKTVLVLVILVLVIIFSLLGLSLMI